MIEVRYNDGVTKTYNNYDKITNQKNITRIIISDCTNQTFIFKDLEKLGNLHADECKNCIFKIFNINLGVLFFTNCNLNEIYIENDDFNLIDKDYLESSFDDCKIKKLTFKDSTISFSFDNTEIDKIIFDNITTDKNDYIKYEEYILKNYHNKIHRRRRIYLLNEIQIENNINIYENNNKNYKEKNMLYLCDRCKRKVIKYNLINIRHTTKYDYSIDNKKHLNYRTCC